MSRFLLPRDDTSTLPYLDAIPSSSILRSALNFDVPRMDGLNRNLAKILWPNLTRRSFPEKNRRSRKGG